MVSLSSNSRHPGVTFFTDDNALIQSDDDPLLDTMPILPHEPSVNQWMAEEMRHFRTIKTTKAIIAIKFIYICLELAAFLLPVFCKEKNCGDWATSLVLYIHGAVWFLLLLGHCYLYYEHRNSLLHGYFSFHMQTRNLRRAPLYVNSAANAILVIVSKLLDTVCDNEEVCQFLHKKVYYLQIIISVEVVVALAFLVLYLARTARFNRAKDAPDYLRSDVAHSTPNTHFEVGYRGPSDLKSLAMNQSWNEIYQLRFGFLGLLREKNSLINCARQSFRQNTHGIN